MVDFDWQGLMTQWNIVTPEGEWEAWFDAHWVPGAVRYRSFWEMMVAEHQNYLALRDSGS